MDNNNLGQSPNQELTEKKKKSYSQWTGSLCSILGVIIALYLAGLLFSLTKVQYLIYLPFVILVVAIFLFGINGKKKGTLDVRYFVIGLFWPSIIFFLVFGSCFFPLWLPLFQ